MKKSSDLRIPFVWRDRHPVLLERFLYLPAYYDKHDEWEPVSWSDPRIFGNDQPVALEYCSGNGQWICDRAKQNPHINWVAVEIRFDRSRKIWLRLHRENLTNLYVLCGEASILTRHYIPKRGLSKIFINFPDPWPKLRHAKHRLVQAPFVGEMAAVSLPGCKATFVTDDSVYAAQMLRSLAACSLWQPCFPFPHFVLDCPDYGNSFFLELWKKKGRNIHFMEYNLCN